MTEQDQISEYLAETGRQPFEYSVMDCVRFAAGYYDRFHGTDITRRLPVYNAEEIVENGRYEEVVAAGVAGTGAFAETSEKLAGNLVLCRLKAAPILAIRANAQEVCVRGRFTLHNGMNSGVVTLPDRRVTIVKEWKPWRKQ